jgi:hypothetical protein
MKGKTLVASSGFSIAPFVTQHGRHNPYGMSLKLLQA